MYIYVYIDYMSIYYDSLRLYMTKVYVLPLHFITLYVVLSAIVVRAHSLGSTFNRKFMLLLTKKTTYFLHLELVLL